MPKHHSGMKRHLWTWAAILWVFVACGHPADTPTADSHNTYTDDYGRTVEVPAAPQRIVSTSPAVTDIIFALGGDSLLVGRTDFCTHPVEALRIESIGGISNLNVEKILSLEPDLVISGSMIPKKSTAQMEKMGVPTVHVIEKHRFDDLYQNISLIGGLIGHMAQADSLNRALQQQMKGLVAEEITPAPTVYYVVGFGASGNFTAGGDSFINDIIRMAGGQNIAEGVKGWSYSLEALLNADPDYIVIRKEDKETFCHTAPYTKLTAVKKGHVIPIESGMIDLQVPRNIEAVQLLHAAFSR